VTTDNLPVSDRFLSKPAVLHIAGFSAATLWREVQAGRFPPPVAISANRVGFLESEIRAWLTNKVEQTRRSRAVVPKGADTCEV
jgi:prophage regulatory protein